MPYLYLTLDIETRAGRPEDAERDMRMNWAPSAAWKDETIGKRYHEMLDKKKERLALIDGSHVISIALKSDVDAAVIHCMRAEQPHPLAEARVQGFDTERDMLTALRYVFDTMCDEHTVLVGHNIRDFDLKKLRMAYARNGLRIPAVLGNEVFDTMREWGFRFSATNDPFVSVADVCEVLGIPHHKNLVDGSQIEQLWAAGQFDTIINYNLLDVRTEHDLFLRMTGQNQDSAPATGTGARSASDGEPKPDPLAKLPLSTAGAA